MHWWQSGQFHNTFSNLVHIMVPPESSAAWRRTIHLARSIISEGCVTVFGLHLLLGSLTAVKTLEIAIFKNNYFHILRHFQHQCLLSLSVLQLPLSEVHAESKTLVAR